MQIFQFLKLFFAFSSQRNGLPCNSQTVKKIAKNSRNKEIYLHGVTENFNISDVCDLLKNGYISFLKIVFIRNISMAYQENFKVAIKIMENTWISEYLFSEFVFF